MEPVFRSGSPACWYWPPCPSRARSAAGPSLSPSYRQRPSRSPQPTSPAKCRSRRRNLPAVDSVRVGVFAASRWLCAICRTSGVHPAMTLTVVIAEDEEPSREHLRELAAASPDLHVVGEAGDGHAALRLI